MSLIFCSTGYTHELIACENYHYLPDNDSATSLRMIAARCTNPELAKLYYNRAYHLDLLNESKTYAQIIPYQQEVGDYHFVAARIYITLIELLAPNWFANSTDRISFLNDIYEKRTEIVELRLHGYNKVADILENKYKHP